MEYTHLQQSFYTNEQCAYFTRVNLLHASTCSDLITRYFLCEEDETHAVVYWNTTRRATELSNFTVSSASVPHTVCPSGHWTHVFLACDMMSECWGRGGLKQNRENDPEGNKRSQCGSILSALFTCTNGMQHVPYSLMCDHIQDCMDASDEDFCVYPSCSGSERFECANEQV